MHIYMSLYFDPVELAGVTYKYCCPPFRSAAAENSVDAEFICPASHEYRSDTLDDLLLPVST